jgi:hypothetical protein
MDCKGDEVSFSLDDDTNVLTITQRSPITIAYIDFLIGSIDDITVVKNIEIND